VLEGASAQILADPLPNLRRTGSAALPLRGAGFGPSMAAATTVASTVPAVSMPSLLVARRKPSRFIARRGCWLRVITWEAAEDAGAEVRKYLILRSGSGDTPVSR
jgi:hypothetical protein